MAKTPQKNSKKKDPTIALNKRARYDFLLTDFIEAGLVLQGSEVKALREGRGQITESYAVFQGDEMFLMNSLISQYSHAGSATGHEERRSRKLLLHKTENLRLKQQKERENATFVPTKLYWSKGKIKVELGIAQGKKQHDKRAAIKERDWQRQKNRLLKNAR